MTYNTSVSQDYTYNSAITRFPFSNKISYPVQKDDNLFSFSKYNTVEQESKLFVLLSLIQKIIEKYLPKYNLIQKPEQIYPSTYLVQCEMAYGIQVPTHPEYVQMPECQADYGIVCKPTSEDMFINKTGK